MDVSVLARGLLSRRLRDLLMRETYTRYARVFKRNDASKSVEAIKSVRKSLFF